MDGKKSSPKDTESLVLYKLINVSKNLHFRQFSSFLFLEQSKVVYRIFRGSKKYFFPADCRTPEKRFYTNIYGFNTLCGICFCVQNQLQMILISGKRQNLLGPYKILKISFFSEQRCKITARAGSHRNISSVEISFPHTLVKNIYYCT